MDKEWILLMQTAKEMGMTTEEVRRYLHTCKSKQSHQHKQHAQQNPYQQATLLSN